MKAEPFSLLKFTPKPAPVLSADEQYVVDHYRRVSATGEHNTLRFLYLVKKTADSLVPAENGASGELRQP